MTDLRKSTDQKADLLTTDFDFNLPLDSIAQKPIEPRDHARLLFVQSEHLSDHQVYNLPELLRDGDLLVMNDTKVIPARLYGRRDRVTVEFLLHKEESADTWLAFARPGKRLRLRDKIVFAENFFAEVLEKRENGLIKARFSAKGSQLREFLMTYGEPPLPPYIKREPGGAKDDLLRYQTIYAKHEGAVAAPTAGLHFTAQLFQSLAAKNIKHVTVTLHVGAGTFMPVKTAHVRDHVMHAEWGQISLAVAQQINQARAEGRRIIAVGTTSLRLLESAADQKGTINAFTGDTNIFIYPGYQFKAVDLLMTNFHLPKSTLFMLVSAFAGQAAMRRAYAHAIDQKYRFYSYGDATLLARASA